MVKGGNQVVKGGNQVDKDKISELKVEIRRVAG